MKYYYLKIFRGDIKEDSRSDTRRPPGGKGAGASPGAAIFNFCICRLYRRSASPIRNKSRGGIRLQNVISRHFEISWLFTENRALAPVTSDVAVNNCETGKVRENLSHPFSRDKRHQIKPKSSYSARPRKTIQRLMTPGSSRFANFASAKKTPFPGIREEGVSSGMIVSVMADKRVHTK